MTNETTTAATDTSPEHPRWCEPRTECVDEHTMPIHKGFPTAWAGTDVTRTEYKLTPIRYFDNVPLIRLGIRDDDNQQHGWVEMDIADIDTLITNLQTVRGQYLAEVHRDMSLACFSGPLGDQARQVALDEIRRENGEAGR